MRLTVTVLGAELFSVELRRLDPADEPGEDEEDSGGATGGQFELGFRPPRPAWSVLPGDDLSRQRDRPD